MPHRILIADDDATILEVLEGYLNGVLGYDVTSVLDGPSALDAASQAPFHLCILDVAMPGLSGAETYMRLRNMYPDIEAIFFTGDKEFEHKMDFLRFSLPSERVLTKPIVSLAEITRLIVSILGPPVP